MKAHFQQQWKNPFYCNNFNFLQFFSLVEHISMDMNLPFTVHWLEFPCYELQQQLVKTDCPVHLSAFFFTSQHSQYQSFQWQWIKELLQKKNSFVSDVWDSLLIIRLCDISELLLLSVIQIPHRKMEKNMHWPLWPSLVLDLFFLGIYKTQEWKTVPLYKEQDWNTIFSC